MLRRCSELVLNVFGTRLKVFRTLWELIFEIIFITVGPVFGTLLDRCGDCFGTCCELGWNMRGTSFDLFVDLFRNFSEPSLEHVLECFWHTVGTVLGTCWELCCEVIGTLCWKFVGS